MLKNLFFNPFSDQVMSRFFNSGMEDENSPILQPQDLKFSKNLSLKISLFSLILYLIALLSYWNGYNNISNLFIILTFFTSGPQAIIKTLVNLQKYKVNIDTLMTCAAFGSIFIDSALEGALLLVLFAISESLSSMVSNKTKNTIASLKQLSPNYAWKILPNNQLKKTSLNQININDNIKIKSGDVIPLDGVIVNGASSINLMHLTGEKIPQPCKIGDTVFAGAINLEGTIDISVQKTGSDSTIARIINLVSEAQNSKPKLQQKLNKYSSIYAVGIFMIALAIVIVPPSFSILPVLGIHGSLYRSLAFLIAASPCALILAIPIAYLSAINSCAKQGILLKGGVILDSLATCKTIIVDKTGTVTKGDVTCSKHLLFGDSSDIFLSSLLYLEQSSSHPIAKAISTYLEQLKIQPKQASSIESLPGIGIKGMINHNEIFIGKVDLALSHISSHLKNQITEHIEQAKQKGFICSLAYYQQSAVLFLLEDHPRQDTKQTISDLKKLGYPIIMLTGDHKISAETTAQELGIDEVYSSLSPEDKLSKVKEFSQKEPVLMIGDGINDAPALALATVGISMGEGGSATAIEASDVILLHDSFSSLTWLLKKVFSTKAIVKQNLFIALSIILGISIPAALGFIPLWLAVILHEGSTIIIGLNSLRLIK